MILSKRLQLIASLVKEGSSVADIGADHGYLSIYLANNACEVTLSDNKIAPLKNAKTNIEKYQLIDKIQIILADGIEHISDQKYIIIAGMGGQLIKKILQQHLNKIKEDMVIILQPNNKEYYLRSFLQNNFKILHEYIIEERKIYEIIVCCLGTNKYQKQDLIFGPCLRQERTDIFIKKWTKELEKLYALLAQLNANNIVNKTINNNIKLIEKEIYGQEITN